MAAKAEYSATTRQIWVSVNPIYLDDRSAPEHNHFVWAYHVVIENRGAETVQLRSRHWRITNARGELREVRGPGVVGEQPRLEPGDASPHRPRLGPRPSSWPTARGTADGVGGRSPNASVRRDTPSIRPATRAWATGRTS